jgi:hypothetical protein
MNSVSFSLLVFVCTFGGGLLGVLVNRLLPARHVSPESKDVVRLGMGLVATTVALVLGLLVASAKNFYDTQTAEVTQLAANIALLDRLLAHYGPEAAETRAALRASLIRQRELMWHEDSADETGAPFGAQAHEVVLDKLQELAPKDDKQRSLQSQALSLSIQIGQTRLLMSEQKRVPIPRLLLVMLIFWLFALFVSFGIFASPNFLVLVSLFVAAAAVCGALFLIVDMYHPYSGLIQVSDAPLRAVITQLSQ